MCALTFGDDVRTAVAAANSEVYANSAAALSGVLQTYRARFLSLVPTPLNLAGPVVTTTSFSVEVPELEETSVDFGLLVDVTGSYR